MKWMKTWLLLILPSAIKIIIPFYTVMTVVIFSVFVVIYLMRYFGLSDEMVKAGGVVVFIIGLAIWDAIVGFAPEEGFGLSKKKLEESSVNTSSYQFDFIYGATIIILGLPLPLLMIIAIIQMLDFTK